VTAGPAAWARGHARGGSPRAAGDASRGAKRTACPGGAGRAERRGLGRCRSLPEAIGISLAGGGAARGPPGPAGLRIPPVHCEPPTRFPEAGSVAKRGRASQHIGDQIDHKLRGVAHRARPSGPQLAHQVCGAIRIATSGTHGGRGP